MSEWRPVFDRNTVRLIPGIRSQIEAELELALAEREIFVAEQEGRISAEPPF